MGEAVEPWWCRAACRGMDTELFFPLNGDYGPVRAICLSCPVRLFCLEDALAQEYDRYGFFGGTTPKDRARMRLERMRYDYRPDQG